MPIEISVNLRCVRFYQRLIVRCLISSGNFVWILCNSVTKKIDFSIGIGTKAIQYSFFHYVSFDNTYFIFIQWRLTILFSVKMADVRYSLGFLIHTYTAETRKR